jgi:hypothetical protein
MKVSDATLLRMWGMVVKGRAGNKCEYPHCEVKSNQLHPHHYYSKRNASVRYDPLNGICLCAVHHALGNESAHHDPNFKDVILSAGVRTHEWHWMITARKNEVVKNNQFFKENCKILLKIELDKINKK